MKKGLKLSLILVVIALGIYGLNSVVNGADEESPAGIKERFQKAWDEALMKGNLDALDEVYGTDILDGFKSLANNLRVTFSECRLIIDGGIVSGDRGIFQWTLQGTVAAQRSEKWIFQNKETGESETIHVSIPAGAKYTQKGCTIVRMVNSKAVKELAAYSDGIVPALRAAGIERKIEPVE